MSITHFIEFQGGPARGDKGKLRVTLNPRGVFFFNRSAYEQLRSPAAVTLHFDPNNQLIALKPADPQKSNAFLVKTKDRWKNRTLNAISFCNHFKIKVDRTVLFSGVQVTDEGLMMLDIKNAVGIGKEGTARA